MMKVGIETWRVADVGLLNHQENFRKHAWVLPLQPIKTISVRV